MKIQDKHSRIWATAFKGATAWEAQVLGLYVKVAYWRFGPSISFGWDQEWFR